MKQNFFVKRNATLIVVFVFLANVINAKEIYVDGWCETPGNGTNWNTAYKTWGEAMTEANSGDVIYVAGGYVDKTTGTATPQEYQPAAGTTFLWKAGVNVYGGYDPISGKRDTKLYETILRANGARILYVGSGFTTDTYIDGFTLLGATGDNNGGATYLLFGQHLINCRITGNTGKNGAVNLDGRTNAGNLLPSVENSIIDNNTCSNTGGGVCISYAGLIKNCIIINNKSTGSSGGGVAVSGSNYPVTIINTLIANNEASNNGGGVWAKGGDFINCTIVNNKATNTEENDGKGNGGGVLLDWNVNHPTTLTNCVVWGNVTAKAAADFTTYGARQQVYPGGGAYERGVIKYTAIQSLAAISEEWIPKANNCINLPETNTEGAKFVNPSINQGVISEYVADWTLIQGSLLINAGDNAAVQETTDLAGKARIVGTVDLGAYEYQIPSGVSRYEYDKSLTCYKSNGGLVFSQKNDKATVYDTNGKTLKTAKNCKVLGISELSNGVYFVKMEAENRQNIQKFIK